ncbi:hypothetical protein R3P38DRAFT_1654639 [Favolaschia claudopus]|uniref:Uncharacterized protein n=1 Tax=Favolaschia claudopus TaxID=2862362 RepID=A0AAW0DN31_9AGAR
MIRLLSPYSSTALVPTPLYRRCRVLTAAPPDSLPLYLLCPTSTLRYLRTHRDQLVSSYPSLPPVHTTIVSYISLSYTSVYLDTLCTYLTPSSIVHLLSSLHRGQRIRESTLLPLPCPCLPSSRLVLALARLLLTPTFDVVLGFLSISPTPRFYPSLFSCISTSLPPSFMCAHDDSLADPLSWCPPRPARAAPSSPSSFLTFLPVAYKPPPPTHRAGL